MPCWLSIGLLGLPAQANETAARWPYVEMKPPFVGTIGLGRGISVNEVRCRIARMTHRVERISITILTQHQTGSAVRSETPERLGHLGGKEQSR